MTPLQPRRLAARLLVAAAAGALTAGALALPASAQSIDDPDVFFQFEPTIVPGGERDYGAIEIDFGPEFPPNTHTVGADLQIHTDLDGFEFDLPGAFGHCEKSDAGTGVNCTSPDAGSYTYFGFEYWANDLAEPGVYDYTLTITVDSAAVKTVDGHIEIADAFVSDPHRPFRHSDLEVTGAVPGDAVEVAPKFLQEQALADDAAAVIVFFGDPFARVGMDLEGAEAVAEYDNCFDGGWSSDRGVTCVITHYEEAPGDLFTLSGPVTYEIGESAPGPLDICQCTYSIRTVDATMLEEDFGGVFWDEGSDNLLGLSPTDSWNGPTDKYDAPYLGTLTIVTAENPFDLAINDVNVEGSAGDQVTVTVPVTNHGPAAAPHRVDFYGSHAVRGQLPAGLELVSVDSEEADAWACLGLDSLADEYERHEDRTELERFDFSCYFERLSPGETVDFAFTVAITDASTAVDGRIEAAPIFDTPYADTLDGDLENNLALIGVNAADLIGNGGDGDASGELPVTGASMTVVAAAAAAAVVAGAIVFVLFRRRKAAADW